MSWPELHAEKRKFEQAHNNIVFSAPMTRTDADEPVPNVMYTKIDGTQLCRLHTYQHGQELVFDDKAYTVRGLRGAF